MRFDEAEYRDGFLKQHRDARGAPGDVMARYAITLPATDDEIAAQVSAVRAYWNKIYNGKATWAHVAKLCRTEDERLRAQHGTKMLAASWWQSRWMQEPPRRKSAATHRPTSPSGQRSRSCARRCGTVLTSATSRSTTW